MPHPDVIAADEMSRGIANARKRIAEAPAGKTLVDRFTDAELEAMDENKVRALVCDTDEASL